MSSFRWTIKSDGRTSGSLAEPEFALTGFVLPAHTKIHPLAAVIPRIQNVSTANYTYNIAAAAGTIAAGYYADIDAAMNALAAASAGTSVSYDSVANRVTISRGAAFDAYGTLLVWLGFGCSTGAGTPLTGSASYTAANAPFAPGNAVNMPLHHDVVYIRCNELYAAAAMSAHQYATFGSAEPHSCLWAVPLAGPSGSETNIVDLSGADAAVVLDSALAGHKVTFSVLLGGSSIGTVPTIEYPWTLILQVVTPT